MVGYGEVYYGLHNAGMNYPAGVGSGAYRISIQKKAYAGAATELGIHAHSEVMKQEPEKKQKFFHSCSTSFTVNFIEESFLTLQQFFTEDDREWCLEYTKDAVLIYRGWIFGQNVKERYFSNTFEITATDGLKELANMPFVDVDGLPITSKITCMEVLAHINRIIGLDLPISSLMTIYEQSQSQTTADNVLTVVKPEQQRYLNDDGSAKNCKLILDNLCNLFGANCYQQDGVLCFDRWSAVGEGATHRQNYTSAGVYVNNTALPTVFEFGADTSHMVEFPQLEVDMEYAVEEVTLDYSYKGGQLLSTNPEFSKRTFGGGSTETEITISGENKITKKTLCNFSGYTAFGTAEISLIELNDNAYQQLVTYLGKATPGQSGLNMTLEKAIRTYMHIRKGADQNSGVRTEKNFLIKDSLINLEIGVTLLNSQIGNYAEWAIVAEEPSGKKWYLAWAQGIKRWQETYVNNAPFRFEGETTLQANFILIPNLGTAYNSLRAVGFTMPFTGYLYAEFKPNDNSTEGVFQHYQLSVNSAKLNIETERHAANNPNKHTRVLETEVLGFSDESMGYLPSTLWVGSKIAGYFSLKGNVKQYKLIDLAVETIFQQYHRPSQIIYVDYVGMKLNIGQYVFFNGTEYPKLSGVKFRVTDNRSYCFENMMGSCTLHEVFTDFAEYDRNNQVLDKDGKTIHIVSDRITSAVSSTITPWVFNNIGGATGSAARFVSTYFVTAGGNDIWDNADNMNLLWRAGGNRSVEGTVAFGNEVVDDGAKIGIMYRESLDADSRFYAIVKRKDGYVVVISRDVEGGPANMLANIPPPNNVDRFKVDHVDGVLKAYYYNGNGWTILNTDAMVFDPTDAVIGFCTAMMGDTNTVALTNVVYTDLTPQSVTKPAGLIAISTQVKSEVTSSGEITKPLNLIAISTQVKSAGDPVVGSEPVPSMGFHVLTFNQKAGMRFFQTGPEVIAMKLEANLGAGTVTDTAYNWKPTLRDANGNLLTVYIKWKMNTGKWHGVYPGGDGIRLENIVIPAGQRGKQTTFTKYPFTTDNFYQPKKYPLQQVIILNAT